MSTSGTAGTPSNEVHPSGSREAARVVRSVVDRLEMLDPTTGRYLSGLAFVLIRVADADNDIRPEETARIEQLLRETVGLPEDQLVLVVEIAKHRTRLADCACAYSVSRDLRHQLDSEQRDGLLRWFVAVAEADGRVSRREWREIRQIAAELGFAHDEVDAARPS